MPGPVTGIRTLKGSKIAVSALLLAGALSRLPFTSSIPINWDAVQFALALDHFDLHAHQPHPPGYILYVMLGWAVNLLVGNPSLSLMLLSVLASAVAVPLAYLLALDIFDDPWVALGAALLVLGSPLTLYYGAVGLTYVPEMLFSIAVAWAAWRLKNKPTVRAAITLGATLALAGGIRQTSIVVLLPLCVWAMWNAPLKTVASFVIATTTSITVWLVPLIILSGGPNAYLRENTLLAQSVSIYTSIWAAGIKGVAYNIAFEGLALVVGLAFGMLPLGLWASRVIRFSLAQDVKAFMAWWIFPTLILYALSHVGQYGYVLVVFPPVAMLSSLSVRVLTSASVRFHNGGTLVCALLSFASACYFLFAQGPTTASNIKTNSNHWADIRAALKNINPEQAVLVMSAEWAGPFRNAGYLLPEYHTYAYGDEKPLRGKSGWLYSAFKGYSTYSLPRPEPVDRIELPQGTNIIVALDEETGQMLSAETNAYRVLLGDGSSLYMLNSSPSTMRGLVISEKRLTPLYNK